MKPVDSIIRPVRTPAAPPAPAVVAVRHRRSFGLATFVRGVFASKLALVAILGASVLPLTAFEAHVVNVTAKIERKELPPPPGGTCDARSLGFFRNHEGCSKGEGSSNWAPQVNALSNTYSSVLANMSGAQMCVQLWKIQGDTQLEQRRFKAKAHLLVLEMNIVSGRLDLNALLAGADNGDNAFSRLGLSGFSTVDQAIKKMELVLADPGATKQNYNDVIYVSSRIWEFYEDGNPFAPRCIFDPKDVPACVDAQRDRPKKEKDDDDDLEREERIAIPEPPKPPEAPSAPSAPEIPSAPDAPASSDSVSSEGDSDDDKLVPDPDRQAERDARRQERKKDREPESEAPASSTPATEESTSSVESATETSAPAPDELPPAVNPPPPADVPAPPAEQPTA
jgi:hypothetical protein